MSLTLAQLCTRISNAITAAGTETYPWKLSREHPINLGEDSSSIKNGAFSVWSPQDRRFVPNERQRRPEGVHVEATIEVRFAWTIKGDGRAASVTAAYDAEDVLRKAVAGISRADLPFFVYDETNRELLEDGETQRHTLRWIAHFTRELQ